MIDRYYPEPCCRGCWEVWLSGFQALQWRQPWRREKDPACKCPSQTGLWVSPHTPLWSGADHQLLLPASCLQNKDSNGARPPGRTSHMDLAEPKGHGTSGRLTHASCSQGCTRASSWTGPSAALCPFCPVEFPMVGLARVGTGHLVPTPSLSDSGLGTCAQGISPLPGAPPSSCICSTHSSTISDGDNHSVSSGHSEP